MILFFQKILEYSYELSTQQFRLTLEVLCSLSCTIKTSEYSNANHKEAADTVKEHLGKLDQNS